MTATAQPSSSFRIGAVSRLTGVSADTLRVWERRYRVVEPLRTEGGSRLYSQRDVARLALIKRLVDAGHAIGTVAKLSLDQLEARASTAQAAQATSDRRRTGPLALVIVGVTLPLRMEGELRDLDGESLTLAGSYADVADFESAAGELQADVLVVELPTLNDEAVVRVRRMQRLCSARRLVVVYGFGQSGTLGRLEDQGGLALRFPVSWAELRRACAPDVPPVRPPPEAVDVDTALGAPVPARLFDDRALAVLSATSTPTSIRCECPRHLADLIVSLGRFEQYSAECENRSRDDAALHAYLHVTTARARALLEEALQKLLEVDGIDIGSHR